MIKCQCGAELEHVGPRSLPMCGPCKRERKKRQTRESYDRHLPVIKSRERKHVPRKYVRGSADLYRAKHGIEKRKPGRFYAVACPTCDAAQGRPCHEINAVTRYVLPHVKRIAAVKQAESLRD